jgi:hypothetical protein
MTVVRQVYRSAEEDDKVERLCRDVMPRLCRDFVDSNLKHRKATLQLQGALLGPFFGREFGVQTTIDFERKSGFRQFDVGADHFESQRNVLMQFG